MLLIVAPIGATIWLSIEEQKEYVVSEELKIEEVAYGELDNVRRESVEEMISVSGEVVSNESYFWEIGQYSDSMKWRFVVSEGDYVEKGTLIGYYDREEVYADISGIIEEISTGDAGYIKLASTSELALELMVETNEEYRLLTSNEQVFTDSEGGEYHLLSSQDYIDESGFRKIRFSVPDENNWMLGQKVTDLVLLSGKTFDNVLVVDKDCVYSYDDGLTYYVRVQDEFGDFNETEVKLGQIVGDLACITGVEEGTLCDSGYKIIAEKREDE